MDQTAFDSSYTALTVDGAKYLVERTNVRTVGIDYLSIGAYDQSTEVHLELFKKVNEADPPAWPRLSPIGNLFPNWLYYILDPIITYYLSDHPSHL